MVARRYYYKQLGDVRVTRKLKRRVENNRRIRGFLYPDGRLTVARVPPPKVGRAEQEYEKNRRIDLYQERQYWDYQEGIVREIVQTTQREEVSSLGLSSVQNYHSDNSKGRYGLRGISPGGRKSVRDSAYVLHRRYHRRLGFYTLTCPYTLATDIFEYNKLLNEIARRYFQECKRMYEYHGYTWSCVFVYEYQEERYEESGVPVLHIHYIAPCYVPGSTEFILTATEIRYLWMRSCAQVVGKEADTSASVDATVVHTSAIGYISKYLSKGGQVVEYLADTAQSQVPSQWWGSTRNVKRAVKRLTVELPTPVAEYLFYGGGTNPDEPLYTTYRKYITINLGVDPRSNEDMLYCVGMSGRLCEQDRRSIIGYTKEALAVLFI